MTARIIRTIAASCITCATVAFAQNPTQPKASQHSVGNTERLATEPYWTVDRLANAKPMPLREVDPFSTPNLVSPPATGNEKPGYVQSGHPVLTTASGELSALQQDTASFEMLNHGDNVQVQPEGFSYVFPYNTYRPPVLNAFPYSAVGKLFFAVPAGASEPPGEYVCSASVDANSHTVITARHCVFDYPTGKWFSNWQFCPAYNSGPNPVYHNCWTARRAATWTSGAAGFDFDIGLLQMNDAAGFGCGGSSKTAPVGNYTGWLGAAWNTNFSQSQWEIFGYPQASPFDGNHQYQTDAATGTTNPFGYNNVVEVGSNQTGGTSGGPWILGLDPLFAPDPSPSNNIFPNSGNWVNSVNSFKFTNPNQSQAINGPEFQTYNFFNLYSFYSGLSCP